MIKKVLFCIFLLISPAFAFEDCVIISDGKLTDINIEDNTIIDVYPIVTVMNDKNTLIVHPLKQGKTRFCLLKNNKNLSLFDVSVDELTTKINAPADFEVLSLDKPTDDIEFTLDEPPIIKE
ncbi:MAG: hypothetical protein MJ230_01310 [bacterium]|mgnify:CR=1 FL=1|nr:hypothetical protein [bacterium]